MGTFETITYAARDGIAEIALAGRRSGMQQRSRCSKNSERRPTWQARMTTSEPCW